MGHHRPHAGVSLWDKHHLRRAGRRSGVPRCEHRRRVRPQGRRQLNALILRRGKFTSEWYDPFPLGRALDAQKKSARSAYIRWGDNAVEPIELGREWCRIRHIRTGYVMDVPTDFLYESKGVLRVNDVTDYRPAIAPGETLSIVRETDRGYWIKKNGVSGWYSGRVERL